MVEYTDSLIAFQRASLSNWAMTARRARERVKRGKQDAETAD